MLAIVSRHDQHIAKDVQHGKSARSDDREMPLTHRRDEVHRDLRRSRAGVHQQGDRPRCAASLLAGYEVDHIDLDIGVQNGANKVKKVRRLVIEESQRQRLVPVRQPPPGI